MKRDPLPKTEVIKAIERKNPTHIPALYNWIADETREKYGQELKVILDNYTDDIMLVNYDMPEDFVEPAPGRDEWWIYYIDEPGVIKGMRTSDLKAGGWDAIKEKLIKHFPDPYAKGRFDKVKEIRKQNPDVYLMGHWWATFFERFIALRKEEDLLIDLLINKEKVEKLGWMICDFFCGIVDGFAESEMDGVFFSDDLAFSTQLIFRPELFRELFKPWFKKLFERIHKHNMHVIYHSCGHLWEIIPDLIEIGMDVHHFQPSVMDMKRYVREFGKDLSFFGGIDIQEFLINTNPAGVRKGIEEIYSVLDHDGGGFIAGTGNSVMPDTPFENIAAMLEAMEEYSDRSKLKHNERNFV